MFVQFPDSETHFKREVINHKAIQRTFKKSKEERDQLRRAKANKRTLSPRSVLADYIRSGETVNLPFGKINFFK